MSKLFVWFHNRQPGIKAAITGFFAIIAFVLGALLEDGVQRLTGDQPGDVPLGLLWLVLAFVAAAASAVLHYWYHRVLESQKRDWEVRERAIADARERITKLTC